MPGQRAGHGGTAPPARPAIRANRTLTAPGGRQWIVVHAMGRPPIHHLQKPAPPSVIPGCIPVIRAKCRPPPTGRRPGLCHRKAILLWVLHYPPMLVANCLVLVPANAPNATYRLPGRLLG